MSDRVIRPIRAYVCRYLEVSPIPLAKSIEWGLMVNRRLKCRPIPRDTDFGGYKIYLADQKNFRLIKKLESSGISVSLACKIVKQGSKWLVSLFSSGIGGVSLRYLCGISRYLSVSAEKYLQIQLSPPYYISC